MWCLIVLYIMWGCWLIEKGQLSQFYDVYCTRTNLNNINQPGSWEGVMSWTHGRLCILRNTDVLIIMEHVWSCLSVSLLQDLTQRYSHTCSLVFLMIDCKCVLVNAFQFFIGYKLLMSIFILLSWVLIT